MRFALVAWVVVAVAIGGCSSSGSTGTAGRESTEVPSSSAPPACSNPEGGVCLGPLAGGQTYTTVEFRPDLTYSVSGDGWRNYEDTPGNFLLVPPGNDLPGVNAGTSDFLGVYTSITASRFIDLPSCATSPLSGVARTPRAIASWMQRQTVLQVTKPAAVSVGGLSGLLTDVRTKPGAKLPTCVDSGTRVTVFVLFSGLDPSSLDHGVIADMTMRLYLLRYDDGVLVIELDDIDGAPGTLQSLSSVAENLEFGS